MIILGKLNIMFYPIIVYANIPAGFGPDIFELGEEELQVFRSIMDTFIILFNYY